MSSISISNYSPARQSNSITNTAFNLNATSISPEDTIQSTCEEICEQLCDFSSITDGSGAMVKSNLNVHLIQLGSLNAGQKLLEAIKTFTSKDSHDGRTYNYKLSITTPIPGGSIEPEGSIENAQIIENAESNPDFLSTSDLKLIQNDNTYTIQTELTYPHKLLSSITIPMLVKNNGESNSSNPYTVIDIEIPSFIAIGHELIHIFHKLSTIKGELPNLEEKLLDAIDKFTKLENEIGHPAPLEQKPTFKGVIDKVITNVNNWGDHRNNLRSIGTLFGFNPENSNDNAHDDSENNSPISSDSDLSINFEDFETPTIDATAASEEWKKFQDQWGDTKCYEEFRTITGKECNILNKANKDSYDEIQFTNTHLSERHFLSEYFLDIQKQPSISGLSFPEKPFCTRWTHSFDANEVDQTDPATFKIVGNVLGQNTQNLPTLNARPPQDLNLKNLA